MLDKEYRHGLVSAQIEIDLPLQIAALRKQRVWTQADLAAEAEMKQPRISAMEQPGGANFTLETLRRLAKAFDVALIVRFAPFDELLRWVQWFNPDLFQIDTFTKDARANTEGSSARSMAVKPTQIDDFLLSSMVERYSITADTGKVYFVGESATSESIPRKGPSSELLILPEASATQQRLAPFQIS